MMISLSKRTRGGGTKWAVSWLGNQDGKTGKLRDGISLIMQPVLQPWRFTLSLPNYHRSEPHSYI
ncbi:unnamed protein product [Coffea canephora]|uniref:DH200=94 genomic scaffold, scaffold_764 n=1 Tax=Coffea canephora TaxID=49390 RepID=A0A068VGP1_COFCA|nr:unnamed protein product [Coffea canephora]